MLRNLNELALFAGAGGGLLASKWLLGWRTICYVEIEPYAVACLVARIKDGLLEDAPIWDDARTFDGARWRGLVDIITAGFPCQPFSVAGKRKGAEDERNLWPDTIRIICEVRPRYVLLENVPGLLADKYVRRIFGDLAQSGYDCRWRCLSAAEVGAPHLRDRIWIMAYNNNARLSEFKISKEKCEIRHGLDWSHFFPAGWYLNPSQAIMDRSISRISNRLDRLKALGEGQIPLVVSTVWELLNE